MSGQSTKIKKRQHQLTLKIKKVLSQMPSVDIVPASSKLQYTDNIQNGRFAKLSYLRQKQIANIFMVLLCINILMLYIYYELDFNDNQMTWYWLLLTYLIHISCNILIGILFSISYENLNKISKNQYNYAFDIGKILLFFVIHPFPWINQQTIQVRYDDSSYSNQQFLFKVNYLLLIISVIKNLIIIFVNSLVNTPYIGPRTNRVKKIYSVHAKEIIYAIRCILRDFPIKIFASCFIIGELFFAYTLKITESGAPIPNNPFRYYINCIWFVIITNTTVGFGEFRTFTNVGRIFNIFCMIWGSIFISSILVILVNTLTLNSREETALTALKRVQNSLQYRQICKKYIRISLARLWRNYKNREHRSEGIFQRKVRLYLCQIRRQNKTFNSTGNITQLSQRQFDNVLINVEYLIKNNSQLLSFIGNHIFSENLYHVSSKTFPNTPQTPKTDNYTIQQSEQSDHIQTISIRKIEKFSRFNNASRKTNKNIKIKLFRQPSAGEEQISEYKSTKKYQ